MGIVLQSWERVGFGGCKAPAAPICSAFLWEQAGLVGLLHLFNNCQCGFFNAVGFLLYLQKGLSKACVAQE